MLFAALTLAAISAALAQHVSQLVYPQGCDVSNNIDTGTTATCAVFYPGQKGSRSRNFMYVNSTGCTSTSVTTLLVFSNDNTCKTQAGSFISIPVSSTRYYVSAPLTSRGGTFFQATSCTSVSMFYSDYCPQCSPGTFSESGAIPCTPCPPGTYGNASGLTSPACSGKCLAPAGSYCTATSPTQYSCPAGSYSSDPGLTSSSGTCTVTAPGYFAGVGSVAPSVCPVGS